MSAEPPAPLDRRALLRRMAIGGAAVWATPMMTSVASAASRRQLRARERVIDWNDYEPGTVVTNGSSATLTITISSVAAPGTRHPADNQMFCPGRPAAQPGNALRFHQRPNANGRQQTITFQFSSPVSATCVPIYDIDALSSWARRPGTAIRSSSTPHRARDRASPLRARWSGPEPWPTAFRNSNSNSNLSGSSMGGNLTHPPRRADRLVLVHLPQRQPDEHTRRRAVHRHGRDHVHLLISGRGCRSGRPRGRWGGCRRS